MIQYLVETIPAGIEAWWSLTLLASWRALPLLGLALLIELVLLRRTSARYHACLWMLVSTRLLLPVSIAAPASLQGPHDQWLLGERASRYFGVSWTETRSVVALPSGVLEIDPGPPADWTPQLEATDPTEVVSSTPMEAFLVGAFFALWPLGALLLALRHIAAYVRFAWQVGQCPERHESELIAMVLSECDALGVGHRPRIREVQTLATPALFGFFRPTICLPPGLIERVTTEDLRRVLRHELAHVVRRDAWTVSLAALTQAIHWPNPLAWFVAFRLRHRCEQAADERTLRDALPVERVAYGRLLLAIAEMSSCPQTRPALGFVPFLSRHGLKRRIERVTAGTPRSSRPLRWLLAIAVLLVAGFGLTDAQEPPRPAPAVNLAMTGFTARLGPLNHSPGNSNDTPTERSLDVAQVLSGLRRRETETDVDAALVRYLAGPNVATFHLEEDRLSYRATEAEHRRIVEMLRGLERGGPCQIATEMRVLDLPLPCGTKFDWRPAPDGTRQTPGRPHRITLLTDDELGQLVRRTSWDPECSILMAPKFTMFNGQTGTLFCGNKRPFCTDVRRSESGTIEPVVEVVECGVRLSVSPTALDDGSIEFALGLRTTEIGRIELANLPPLDPASREGTTVQIPRLAVESVDLSVVLEEGRSLAVAVPKTFDPKATNDEAAARASRTVVLYIFSCRRIPETDRL